jgi:molybdopterin/thiamine biosynthesis adenylyltransferase
MLVALDIQSENPWEVDFPVLEKQFILEENDARKSLFSEAVSHASILVEFVTKRNI